MKNKFNFKQYFKDLLSSITSTASLFKFCVYSWLTPLIILILTLSIMIIPSFVSYNTLQAEDITENTKYVDKILMNVLSSNIDCSVTNGALSCNQDYAPFTSTYTLETKDGDIEYTYKVFIKNNVSDVDFSVGTFETPKENENYLIFFEKSFQYRYVYREPITKTVMEYGYDSSYEKLEGLSFSQIYNNYSNIENADEANQYLQTQANDIILKGFKVVAFNFIYVSILSSAGMYLLFLLIVALLIKGNTMLKKKQGFTYSQALKIAIVSSLQSLLLALLVMLMGSNFMNALGLTLTGRTLYIYIKYTGSKKNTQWSDDLYEYTKDERFKHTA